MDLFGKKRFSGRQVVGMLALSFLLMFAVSGAVNLPNTFTAGTTISAGQVNANLAALNAGLPRMWACQDNNDAFAQLTAAGYTEVDNIVASICC